MNCSNRSDERESPPLPLRGLNRLSMRLHEDPLERGIAQEREKRDGDDEIIELSKEVK